MNKDAMFSITALSLEAFETSSESHPGTALQADCRMAPPAVSVDLPNVYRFGHKENDEEEKAIMETDNRSTQGGCSVLIISPWGDEDNVKVWCAPDLPYLPDIVAELMSEVIVRMHLVPQSKHPGEEKNGEDSIAGGQKGKKHEA
ncbi:hypothetical protein C8J56DRAFT_1032905 [Mycena floridula]|nr:hypothetical protein C8J56DRAFT_1032905 [Mycena floridula]